MTNATSSYRHKLVHDDGDEFVAYQRYLGDGVWQTISVWMIHNRQRSLERAA
jgi:hypothetical protein